MSSARSAEIPAPAPTASFREEAQPARTASRDQILRGIQRLEFELLELRRQLAGTFSAQHLPGEDFMALQCRCSPLEVAFLLDSVIEVVMMPALYPLPEAPPWIAGVLNLRGKSVPVLDVTVRITGAAREIEATDFVVVCTSPQGLVGFVVQELGEPTLITPKEIASPTDGLNVAPYFLGLVQRGDRQVSLLDVGELVVSSGVPQLAA